MVPALERGRIYQLAMPAEKAWLWLYSAYDLRLVAGGLTIEIGRFSHGLLKRLKVLANQRDGLVFRAGSFCEASSNCTILIGGEHRNDRLFNYGLGANSPFKAFVPEEDREYVSLAPSRMTLLGDNVLLSEGATVLAGAQVGTGSVIGAGALVRGDLAPYGIYGGVPAQRLRDRFSGDRQTLHAAARMGDVAAHAIPHLPRQLAKLEAGEIDIDTYLSTTPMLPARPMVEVEIELTGGGLFNLGRPIGFYLDGAKMEDPDTVAKLTSYFTQSPPAGGKLRWTPDVFDLFGLLGAYKAPEPFAFEVAE